MPAYLTVRTNGLFLFKCFKERVVQNSVFQEDFFKANQEIYDLWEILRKTKMSNQGPKITV